MKKNAFKIIHDNKISLVTVNQCINYFVENLVDNTIGNEGAGIVRIKKHIQDQNKKITPCFVKLIQLHLDTNGKINDKATVARVTANYQLFTDGFNKIIEHTKFGFYQFIYEAWYHLLIDLYIETSNEGNKKVSGLSLALIRDLNKTYNLADKEIKRYLSELF